MNSTTRTWVKIRRLFRILGPGLVTGASDDDPSGVATYSQAGAQFGYATLWTALFTFPLMAAMQGMCARIGIVTNEGLAVTLKRFYPRSVLYLVLLFSIPAITLNIGADIQAMGAVCNMVVPAIPTFVFSIIFTGILMVVIIQYSYQKLAAILKWLCLSMLLYVLVPFMTKLEWGNILKSTAVPSITFNKDFLSILVAILGTTISPYLFFWQITMEVERRHGKNTLMVNKKVLHEMTEDVNIGMLLSNLVMYFIILTAGAVLHRAGITQINTVDEAARALEPLAGKLTYAIFTIGIIGTGLLAVPVLAGSQSYMLAETLGWDRGLDKKFGQARPFYLTIVASLMVGLLLDFLGISPIQALVYTAILYGLTAPVLIAVIIHIGNNKAIMKEYTNSRLSNVLGFLTLILMTAAAIALIYFQL